MINPGDAIALRNDVDNLCRQDLEMFAVRAFFVMEGKGLEHGWHISIIANHIMHLLKGDFRRAVVCIPPRYLKTWIISVCATAWMLGRDPQARIICCSYGGGLAEKFSEDTRRLMRTPWFRRLFPGTVLQTGKQTKTEIGTTAGGYRFSTSVGGSMTGRGCDLMVIDDPMKADEAHSPVARKNCEDWFKSTVLTRFNDPKKGRVVVVAQRLHAEDLPGVLLQSGGWEALILAAEQQLDASYEIRPELVKAHLKAGRILQPSRHDKAELAQFKADMGEHDYEAQFNQNPLPPGGATFKASWIKRYSAPPAKAQIQAIVQSWDTAYNNNEANDFSACTTWAICGKDLYLLDVWRGKPAFYELENKVFQLREKFGAHVVIIENMGSGISLLQNVRMQGQNLWALSLKPEGNKISRAHQHTPKFEQGRIWFPEQAEWLVGFESEVFAFPYAKHDDQVDSMTQFLTAFDRPSLMQNIKAFGHTV